MIVLDPQFGVTGEAWDKKDIEQAELGVLFSQLAILNTANSGTTFVSYGTIKVHAMLADVAFVHGYHASDRVYVYKNQQDARGVNCWISSVETITLLYQGG